MTVIPNKMYVIYYLVVMLTNANSRKNYDCDSEQDVFVVYYPVVMLTKVNSRKNYDCNFEQDVCDLLSSVDVDKGQFKEEL
ncbi:hypothetical protein J6590_093337 [Homalodisca vitripennis]|nr:hypothetical protein J6590_093337 [Homalodisca vitripennis]